jgi:hypothetical protein
MNRGKDLQDEGLQVRPICIFLNDGVSRDDTEENRIMRLLTFTLNPRAKALTKSAPF